MDRIFRGSCRCLSKVLSDSADGSFLVVAVAYGFILDAEAVQRLSRHVGQTLTLLTFRIPVLRACHSRGACSLLDFPTSFLAKTLQTPFRMDKYVQAETPIRSQRTENVTISSSMQSGFSFQRVNSVTWLTMLLIERMKK